MSKKTEKLYHVGRGDFGTWHVFNDKCQVAGPYPTEMKAIEVRDDMERDLAKD